MTGSIKVRVRIGLVERVIAELIHGSAKLYLTRLFDAVSC